MPVNVQISLDPRKRWERLVVRILDSAACEGRTLNNVAALLLPFVELVDGQLVQRHLGMSSGPFSVAIGPQRLMFRMPLPTDPPCDCVLHEVGMVPHDKVHHLWDRLRRDAADAARRAGRPAEAIDREEALEAAC